jgi:hypothetical protein
MQKESRIEEGHPCRSCAHDDLDLSQVRSLAGRGLYQGQERDPSGSCLWERKLNFVGQHFWARGYFVSTVGRDEVWIREYIRKQEDEDPRLDQLKCGAEQPSSGGRPHNWGRVSDPTGHFERSHSYPRLCRGILTWATHTRLTWSRVVRSGRHCHPRSFPCVTRFCSTQLMLKIVRRPNTHFTSSFARRVGNAHLVLARSTSSFGTGRPTRHCR